MNPLPSFWKKSKSTSDSDAPLPDEAYAGEFPRERRAMVEQHLWQRGIKDRRILGAMTRVPRQSFIAPAYGSMAYEDHPLDIGFGQTISQPYIVAKTAELARIEPGSRVLEIGVGCGYQTAVLLELGAFVNGIEIVGDLARCARARLANLGYKNFEIREGDGFDGWPDAAPFDAIVLAAAPKQIPPPLLGQLKEGGRLVGPVGQGDGQKMIRVTRGGDEFATEEFFTVRYVPMTGRAQGA